MIREPPAEPYIPFLRTLSRREFPNARGWTTWSDLSNRRADSPTGKFLSPILPTTDWRPRLRKKWATRFLSIERQDSRHGRGPSPGQTRPIFNQDSRNELLRLEVFLSFRRLKISPSYARRWRNIQDAIGSVTAAMIASGNSSGINKPSPAPSR